MNEKKGKFDVQMVREYFIAAGNSNPAVVPFAAVIFNHKNNSV